MMRRPYELLNEISRLKRVNDYEGYKDFIQSLTLTELTLFRRLSLRQVEFCDHRMKQIRSAETGSLLDFTISPSTDHTGRTTYSSLFCNEKGQVTESWWTSPPGSIDHVDLTYLQGRHPNIANEEQVAYVQRRFKEDMYILNEVNA